MGTILIIDDDLGFLMYLGRILADAGYQALPALSIQEAVDLIRRLRTQVELVVLPLSTDLNHVIPALTVGTARPKVIATEDTTQPKYAIAAIVDDVLVKPSSREEPQPRQWLDVVRRVLQPVALT